MGITHFIENTRIPNLLKENDPGHSQQGTGDAVRCEQLPNTFCINMVFSHVAAELGLDPTEVALKNDGYEGHDTDVPRRSSSGAIGKPKRDSLKECIEAGKKAIGWDKKWHAPGAESFPTGRCTASASCLDP